MIEADHAEKQPGILAEFRNFLLRGNVVDLAVAVVIGAASATVVRSLVTDLITPLIGAIFGEPDFSAMTFHIGSAVFRYGNFLNALIGFMTVVAAIFFLVIKPTERLARLTGDTGQQDPTDVDLLTEIRDLLKQRNP
ncbi:MAG: large conductance mechanosensitive channel protein MscL [Solirubrobacterales bacterium]|nr:large conductance mechanosensitive channel protein MscL [Solirubrobacterales bacterium]